MTYLLSFCQVVFKHILADNETRQAAKDLLAFVFAEEDIKNLVAEFFKDVIKMEVVVSQATELGKVLPRLFVVILVTLNSH